jgi:ribosomal protein L19
MLISGSSRYEMKEFRAMSDLVKNLEEKMGQPERPQIFPGDMVRVHVRIVEGNRERVQIFPAP